LLFILIQKHLGKFLVDFSVFFMNVPSSTKNKLLLQLISNPEKTILFNMKNVIEAVDRELIAKELTANKFLRPTNKAGNEIYVITAHDSPHIMREIGRLRELSFRSGGGGTGNETDTDKYDFLEKPYKQLIVWDPDNREIIGGYRFLAGADVMMKENGQPEFVMSHLFTFSQHFIKHYLPYTIELGRAFVQPNYQSTRMGMKSLFALDNLWDGLGALIHTVKGAKYFIGKVTMYNSFPVVARESIYAYLNKHFTDSEGLITPKRPIFISDEMKQNAKNFLTENNPTDDYKHLIKTVRNNGENIPPLFNAYIGLSDTMKIFGYTIDHDFGSVYETGIMITIDDLHPAKQQRYIQPYIDYVNKFIEEQKEARRLAREEKAKLRLERQKAKEARLKAKNR
jgi:hypothetical protein